MTQLLERLRSLEQQRSQVEQLDRALQQLTPVEQAVLRMLVIGGKQTQVSQVSRMLDVDESTVRRWKRRALQKLSNLLYPT